MEMDNNYNVSNNVSKPDTTQNNSYLQNKKLGLTSFIFSLLIFPSYALAFCFSSLNISSFSMELFFFLEKILYGLPFLFSIVALITGILSRKTILGKIGLIIAIVLIVCIVLFFVLGCALLMLGFFTLMTNNIH